VSVQSSNSHKEFCAKEGLSFKLLADTNHGVSSAYGSVTNLVVTKLAARHTFLINPEGVIVREFPDVNPSRHSQEVLAALTQLQATSHCEIVENIEVLRDTINTFHVAF
jgi:peroxiredoxin Q/BCP